jgi:hypothetical protein
MATTPVFTLQEALSAKTGSDLGCYAFIKEVKHMSAT